MRAVIASGSGRYADPWHPFPATSALLAELLAESGFDATVEDDVDAALAGLDAVDLLVVNAGDPWRDSPIRLAPDHPSVLGLADALGRGIGVLAVHNAVASLRDHPGWAAATGAIWVPEASWHPQFGTALITGVALPGSDAVNGFEVDDERYCSLQFVGESHVVAWHDGAAGLEPTAWVRRHGRSRVAVDVLGHDERSYASVGHRDLLRRLARWTTSGP